MVDIEEHQRARSVRGCDDLLQGGKHGPGAKRHGGKDDQIAALKVERVEGKRLEIDAALIAIHAQDEVDRVELGVGREHARLAGQRVQHRAQALTGARLRNYAVARRRIDEFCREVPEALAALHPQGPGAVHVPVPAVERRAQIVCGAVGRAPQGMVGEVDLLAREHAREARPDVRLQPAFIQSRCGHR
jgi:hypothetical protein